MTPEQKDALAALLDQLSAADLEAVTRFAEFLLSRSGSFPASTVPENTRPVSVAAPVEVAQPEAIPRPENERVVAAVKRLSKTYYMLDKKKMLSVTSDLVTQHILQGREAVEVIDELESVFEQHYRQLGQEGQD